jgi:hypothetical protein
LGWWTREFNKTESLVCSATMSNNNNKMMRRSPRLAAKRGETVPEVSPYSAPNVVPVQKKTKAEKRRAFLEELRAIQKGTEGSEGSEGSEAAPSPAPEKTTDAVVFTVFYDPIDKKRYVCGCGKCEDMFRKRLINDWGRMVRPLMSMKGGKLTVKELTDLLSVIYDHPATSLVLRIHKGPFRDVFRKKLVEFRDHRIATPTVRLLCDALLRSVDVASL